MILKNKNLVFYIFFFSILIFSFLFFSLVYADTGSASVTVNTTGLSAPATVNITVSGNDINNNPLPSKVITLTINPYIPPASATISSPASCSAPCNITVGWTASNFPNPQSIATFFSGGTVGQSNGTSLNWNEGLTNGNGSGSAVQANKSAGTYIYCIRAYDASWATGNNLACTTTVVNPTMSGTLTSSSSSCTISSGANSCNINLSWTTTNPVATSAITASGMSNYNSNSGTNISFVVPYNSRTFYLYNNSILLAQTTVIANCISGTAWNGSSCAVVSNPVPVVSFTANPLSVMSGGSTTLTWSATNTPTSCTASSSPYTSSWSGGKATSGSQSISGLTVGTWTLGLYCTNANGNSSTITQNVVVSASATAPSLTSPTHTSITTSGATLGANITSNGGASITARGTCWGTTIDPNSNCANDGGTAIGVFTQARTGMSPNTLYYYRAYATNSVGTGYSTSLSFTTTSSVTIPTVTTVTPVTNIASTSATGGGNVTSNGGATVTVSGLVWSTSTNPTTALSTKTTNGWAIGGPWTSGMTGLTANTLYYVRAYATNSAGTAYGANVTFTTSAASSCLAAGTGSGLTGKYYNDITLTNLITTRIDSTVNFNPADSIGTSYASGADTFSVRWEGQVQPRCSENYTFYITSDDGSRLWVNDVLVATQWVDQGPTEKASTAIPLVAGTKYNIKMEFYENTGGAAAQLSWSSLSTAKAIIPQTQLYPVGAPVLDLKATIWENWTGDGRTAVWNAYSNINGPVNVYNKATYALSWAAVSNATSCTLDGSSVSVSGGTINTYIATLVSKTHTLSCTGTGGTSVDTFVVTLPPMPINPTGTCPTPYTSANLSWTAPAGGYNTFYVRLNEYVSEFENGYTWPPDIQTEVTGTTWNSSSPIPPTTTSGKSYTWWVSSKDTSNGAWSEDAVSFNLVCSPAATIPTVTTVTPVTNIASTSATGGGNVTSNGGATVTVSGLVWSTSTNPTTALSTKTTNGWAIGGPWTSGMTGLTANTLYYVRAYATNSAGTAYGANVTFTTSAAPVNGAPGTANGQIYPSTTTTYGSDTQCSSGTSSNTAFPAIGGVAYWMCLGLNGGTDSGPHSASRSSPSVNFSASSPTIFIGDSVTLTWSTTATSCTGTNFNTSGAPSGNLVVSPTATTTYTITCDGVSALVIVTVKKKPIFIED